jgi:hypothetical protein
VHGHVNVSASLSANVNVASSRRVMELSDGHGRNGRGSDRENDHSCAFHHENGSVSESGCGRENDRDHDRGGHDVRNMPYQPD